MFSTLMFIMCKQGFTRISVCSFNTADTLHMRSASHPLRTFRKMKRSFFHKATFAREMGKKRGIKKRIKEGQGREIRESLRARNGKQNTSASAGIQSHASAIVRGTLNAALISSPRCCF